MANPTSNFNWQMPTSSDLVTDLPADFEVFGQAVDTSLADLKGGTTGQVLSKASNTDMDFTWVAQDDSNAIQNAIVDAKGDLIAATAADTPARLAVGTNGQVLTADSTAATGIKWAAPSSGSLTSLATGSLSGSSTTISSIPSGYVDLYLVIQQVNFSNNATLQFRFNGITTAVYGSHGTGNFGAQYSKSVIWGQGQYQVAGDTTNHFVMTIFDYLNNYPVCQCTWFGTTATPEYAGTIVGAGGAVAGVSSITILPSAGTFNSGSYTLYGVK